MAKRRRRVSVATDRNPIGVNEVIDRYHVSVTMEDTTDGAATGTRGSLIAVGAWLVSVAASQAEPIQTELLATGKRLILIGLALAA